MRDPDDILETMRAHGVEMSPAEVERMRELHRLKASEANTVRKRANYRHRPRAPKAHDNRHMDRRPEKYGRRVNGRTQNH